MDAWLRRCQASCSRKWRHASRYRSKAILLGYCRSEDALGGECTSSARNDASGTVGFSVVEEKFSVDGGGHRTNVRRQGRGGTCICRADAAFEDGGIHSCGRMEVVLFSPPRPAVAIRADLAARLSKRPWWGSWPMLMSPALHPLDGPSLAYRLFGSCD